MKTYSTEIRTGRLAAFLCANSKPFNFDGFAIEFTASDTFMQDMKEGDPLLAVINFKVED